MRFLRASVWSALRHFLVEKRANISILFALTSLGVVFGVGAAVDLGRGYSARQKLSETAMLACQYATRSSVFSDSSNYQSNVNGFITATLQNQRFAYPQTNGTPFTYTPNGAADVRLAASVPTSFMRVAQIAQMPISASSHCYDNPSTIPATPSGTPVVQEGFENAGCSGTCFNYFSPSGQSGQTVSTPVSTPSSATDYRGSAGTPWVIMGYCLEVDAAGVISSSDPEGTHSAELDCDNGSGSAGNSSISTKTSLAAGNYELRYFYRSRITYPNYNPAYVCGSAASDVSWANDTTTANSFPDVTRTNQVNVYLDLNTNGNPPTHRTIDGTQYLAGANLIDMCVYSAGWIERSVRVKINTAGYYWLSFAADGANDSYGGQIDDIRLCPQTCANSLQDNFPSYWPNSTLFEDTFELPSYASGGYINYNGNATLSNGTYTGVGLGGWPSATARGWATAPYNEVAYILVFAQQGWQSLQLDGAITGFMSTTNRLISRPFLLDPGYYRLTYNYVADAVFTSLGSTVYCGATPAAAHVAALTGTGSAVARSLAIPLGTLALNTNTIAVFMSHSLMASTPNSSSTLNATTTYTNPNGTTTTNPAVAPDGVSLTSYNSAQPNPLLDICGYAPTWQTRTADIFIQKPGLYWLTFSSASGAGDNYGGSIDDIRLKALGSVYMASPPASAITIPVPNPQPDSTTAFTGFDLVADPLTPPAALQ